MDVVAPLPKPKKMGRPKKVYGREERLVMAPIDLVQCTTCSLRGHTAADCDLPARHEAIRQGRHRVDIL